MLYKPSVLMPAAFSVVRLRGSTWPLGKLPELMAWKPSGARWLNKASERMLRQLLAVHMNRTFIKRTPSETQAQGQGGEGDQQYRQGQHDPDLEVVTPGDGDAFACQDVQPEQGRQAADRGDFGA